MYRASNYSLSTNTKIRGKYEIKYHFRYLLVLPLFFVGTFAGCTPAVLEISEVPEVTTGDPEVTPGVVTEGEPVTINVTVSASGDGGTAEYSLTLQINNSTVETKKGTISAGENKEVDFSYLPQSAGMYTIDINGKTAVFEAVTPAQFRVGEMTVLPLSPKTDEPITVTTKVTNDGGQSGTYIAALKVNDAVINSQNIQVASGETVSVNATYTAATSGTYVFEFCGAKKEVYVRTSCSFLIPPVKEFRTYTNTLFHYKVTFPRSLNAREEDAYNVYIEDFSSGMYIHVDGLTVKESLNTYFNSVMDEKRQESNLQSSNVTEIKEGDVVTGYTFNFTDISDGRSRYGIGEIIKKGGLGFFAIYASPENLWEEKKETAVKCLDNKVLLCYWYQTNVHHTIPTDT